MSYDRDTGLAATWATSVAQLTTESRRLLDRLAFLAPDAIRIRCWDVAVPGEASDNDAYEARGGLYAYSLVDPRDRRERGRPSGFVVHRLVQDFARRAMNEEGRGAEALREALEWVNAALRRPRRRAELAGSQSARAAGARGRARGGRGGDAGADGSAVQRSWPSALREGGLYGGRTLWRRRALAIDERTYGQDHPNVARDLNNLAALLWDTKRFVEAEPLFRRALAISEKCYGADHPQWLAVSTISRNCLGPRTASPKPSR